MDYAYLKKHK